MVQLWALLLPFQVIRPEVTVQAAAAPVLAAVVVVPVVRFILPFAEWIQFLLLVPLVGQVVPVELPDWVELLDQAQSTPLLRQAAAEPVEPGSKGLLAEPGQSVVFD